MRRKVALALTPPPKEKQGDRRAAGAGAVAVVSGLPLRRTEKRPLRGWPDGPASAWIVRTTAGIRVGDRAITALSANQRRRRSGPLRGRFTLSADRAAQGRPDPTATAPAEFRTYSGAVSRAAAGPDGGRRWSTPHRPSVGFLPTKTSLIENLNKSEKG
jgi:hypothetical protein